MTRVFDIILSGITLLVLFPFSLPIMLALKLTGEGDVFYRQERIGKDGKPFLVWKFATMLRNSPSLAGGLITKKHDPRILPLGGFLRKTKINELPQLINIFVGDMSVVGYRPFAEAHYNLYSDDVKREIGKIRPGLSGIGSIIFKNEEQILHEVVDGERMHDLVITPYKGKLECWYVSHRNLATYLLLIFLTVWAFLCPRSKLVWRLFKDLPPIPSELAAYF